MGGLYENTEQSFSQSKLTRLRLSFIIDFVLRIDKTFINIFAYLAEQFEFDGGYLGLHFLLIVDH